MDHTAQRSNPPTQKHWSYEPPWSDVPALQGMMRPVDKELTLEDCRVEGSIPKTMEGLLVRNSPNQRFAPRSTNYHFFDGDGMVHGMWLSGGKARYLNRWVQTTADFMQQQAGRSLWGGIMDDPLRFPPPEGGSKFKAHGGINVIWHGGKLLALDEFGLPWELDPITLETRGTHDFGGRWTRPFTAHPKFDPGTGEMIGFGYDVHRSPYLEYAVVDADGTMSHRVPIEIPRPAMLHDLWITEHFSVLLDVPIVYSELYAELTGQQWRFEAGLGARLGVIPRRGQASEIRWFEIDPCAIIHTMCGYEQGDELVLYGPRISEFDMARAGTNPTASGAPAQIPSGTEPGIPVLHRWALNLRTGRVSEAPVHPDRPLEFPRINDQYWGRATRYGYALSMHQRSHLKLDLTTGEVEEHVHGEGRFGFEMIFVPHPEARAEDHGWLVGYVYDQRSDRSDLVILDAQRFGAPPVARVKLPQRVPMGPHGVWIPR